MFLRVLQDGSRQRQRSWSSTKFKLKNFFACGFDKNGGKQFCTNFHLIIFNERQVKIIIIIIIVIIVICNLKNTDKL